MRLIDLDTVLSYIKQTCEDTPPTEISPYFFVVGAGISYPPVPLASQIVQHCKDRASKRLRTDEPLETDAMAHYSYWFEQAYPDARRRQMYLRSCIENQPIPPVNLRLAHLLSAGKITNLVVTPNFDDFLSRALTLFGHSHVTWDHIVSPERVDSDQNETTIVHVHGSYKFYDCRNLQGEIGGRAQIDRPTAQYLDDVLRRRVPLVIGYSGWKGDVIMQALKRRLSPDRPLPHNIYWFCYQRSSLDYLPDWLKNNDDVLFVVAEQNSGIDGAEVEAVLSAQQVFESFIRTFTLQAPEITQDPLGKFIQYLCDSLLQDDSVYFISSVIRRVERAKQRELETTQRIDMQLESVRDAIRRSQHAEAVQLAAAIPLQDIEEVQLPDFLETVWEAALALKDDPQNALTGYDCSIAIGDLLGRLDSQNEPAWRKRAAQAWFKKGRSLTSLNQHKQAINAYNEVIKRLQKMTDLDVQKLIADTMFNKANRLDFLDASTQAIAAYNAIVKKFGKATDSVLRSCVGKALLNKGITLNRVGRKQEAIAAYHEVEKRFDKASEASLQELVEKAVHLRHQTLST